MDTFFVELFQKFADKLYTNLALDSLPIFDAGELKKSLKNFEIFEKDETEETFPFDFWMKIGENELKTRNRDRFVLFTRAGEKLEEKERGRGKKKLGHHVFAAIT